MARLPPQHPGKFIRAEWLDPQSLTVSKGAEILGVNRKTLSQVLNGGAGISPQMAIRLAKVTGTSAQMWVYRQAEYELGAVEQDSVKNTVANKSVRKRRRA